MMSTKIYNAYLLEGHSLGSAVTLLHNLKLSTLRPLAEKQKASVLAERAVEQMDKNLLGWLDAHGNYVSLAWDSIRTDQKNVHTGLREPDVDFGCQVSLIAYRKKVYVVLNTEQRAYVEAFEALPSVVDFSYWNNTDRPESVSSKDWKVRERVWKGIFSNGVNSMDDAGLTIDLIPVNGSFYAPTQEEILANLPSLDKRVKRLHLEAACRELLEKVDAEETISAVMRLHRHPKYAEVGEQLKEKLLQDITWKHLTGQVTAEARLSAPSI